MVLLPKKALSLRIANIDMVLRNRPLQAAWAKHAILTQMVLFTCNTCKERFPAFHQAFSSPARVKLDLLRRAKGGEGCQRSSDAASVAGADALLAAMRWMLVLALS